ncbi:hypothetical protein CK203_114956 [Vitis vinifera]|uniref:Uncharacterized protein n=1 Tax=Vitis vinifera TaxID=29760 RepID=A0A438C9V4_VITVI|nr:hypothetical protein CK203_114956 [Vitis vinifera]
MVCASGYKNVLSFAMISTRAILIWLFNVTGEVLGGRLLLLILQVNGYVDRSKPSWRVVSDMHLMKETLRFLDINMGPTIKSDVTTSMLCHKEEIFEPILLYMAMRISSIYTP